MENCIFCKIINGELPSTKIYEDDKILAFKDIEPEAPIHVIVVPKSHICGVNMIDESNSEIISYIFSKLKEITNILGVHDTGYRIICNSGKDGGQTVPHLHFHILGGKSMTKLFSE